MGWRLTDDVDAYDRVVRPFLERDPAASTVALTAVENARADGAPPSRYGWWRDADGDVCGAVSQTPPYPLLLAGVPAAALLPLVEALVTADGPGVEGVSGPTGAAAEFAALWCARTGGRAVLRHAERLFRLGGLVHPPDPGGSARLAEDRDRALVAGWVAAFSAEAGVPSVDADAWAAGRVRDGLVWLWERDGEPVAMAGNSRPAAGMARVGPVYTPRARRGRGYGGAVTAAVTTALLAAGHRHLVLFTDIANPTSNALYQRLGYQPVTDHLQLRFEPRP